MKSYKVCKCCGETKELTPKNWAWQNKEHTKFRTKCRKCTNFDSMISHRIHSEKNKDQDYDDIRELKADSSKVGTYVKFILKSQKAKYPFTQYATMTQNKLYLVKGDLSDCYVLKDDTGKMVKLNKARFKTATLDEMLKS